MNFTITYPNQNLKMDNLRNRNYNWGRTALRLDYLTDIGYIETSKGTRVEVARLNQETLRISLYNLDTGQTIQKPIDFFDQFRVDISYNCFGYCFMDSKFFLPNPEIIIKEEYEEVEFKDAEIILFKEYKGFDDNGEEIYIYSHAVKVLPNGNVSFKPGINLLVEDVPREKAIHTYNFNHEIYIRRK